MKTLDINLFKVKNTLEPQIGRALISEPLSSDDYFSRSVVYLTEYNQLGSMGFVLNKKSEYSLSELIPEIDAEFVVYKGGPVHPNTLHFIHKIPSIPDSLEISNGVYWGGDFEKLKELIRLNLITENQIQFFMGYSGWYPGQLTEEIDRGFWLLVDMDSKSLFFNQNEKFWKDQVKKVGLNVKSWLNVPDNPLFN